MNHRKRSTYELLLHHALVILCYSLAVTSKMYIAYGALSLIVEINSVFLHTRQLFIISQVPKSSLIYKTNALLNIATFLTCRILLLGWMTRWLTLHREEIPLLFFSSGSLGLAVIVSKSNSKSNFEYDQLFVKLEVILCFYYILRMLRNKLGLSCAKRGEFV